MCKGHWYVKTKRFARFRGRFSLNKNLVFSHKILRKYITYLQELSYMTSLTVQGGVLQIQSNIQV
jgi:hypothetical protein